VVFYHRKRGSAAFAVIGPGVVKVEGGAVIKSMSQSRRCHMSIFVLRGVRSTLVTNASNQTTAEAIAASGLSATGSNVTAPGR
jgi:hypothetical protein